MSPLQKRVKSTQDSGAHTIEDQPQQAFPHAEIAATSAEFFVALRLLLAIPEE